MKRLVLALVVLGVLASCSGAAPSAPQTAAAPTAAAPSPSPPWVTYTSSRLHYAIQHPADWEVLETPGEWDPFALIEPRGPGTDTIAPPGANAAGLRDGIVVVSSAVDPGGQSVTQMAARIGSTTQCGASISSADTTLAGEPAHTLSYSCGGPGHLSWVQVTSLHKGRVFTIWFVAISVAVQEYRVLHDQFLAGFRYTD